MRMTKANYNTPILPEHRGNPLIEALPPKLSKEQLVEELSVYPVCDPKLRAEDDYIREEYLSRIDDLRQPLPEYLECFKCVDKAIKDSYSAKNPYTATTQHYLHYLDAQNATIAPTSGHFDAKGVAMSIIGESGVGKTKMISQVLNFFPQVIEHESHNGKLFNLRQVLWVKVECPHDASLRGLCHSILYEIDSATGIEPTKPEKNIATLVEQIERKVRSSFLGLLVIDEIQNLNVGKAGGAETLLNFVLNLINKSGVPILFCGNPDINSVFSQTLRNARRLEAGGYIRMGRINNTEVWELFCEELWALQWTNVETPYSKDLSLHLYQLSCGIIDIAVRVFKKAQELVIGSSDERLTLDLLNHAYQKECPLTGDILESYRNKELNNAVEAVESLSQTKGQTKCNEAGLANAENYQNSNTAPKSRNKSTITGDLTRAHHPEFSSKIAEVLNAAEFSCRIDLTDIYRQASYEESPLDYLRDKELVYDDPLIDLAQSV